MVNENSFEIGRIFVMEGSTQVLVKSNAFSVKGAYPPPGRYHTQFFFINQGALYWCFQLKYHLFQNSFGKVTKTLKI